ncbi:MAG: ATP-binding protein [Thiotrichaceae bacterium]
MITLTFATMLFVGERAGWITVAAIAGFISFLGVLVTQGYIIFNFDYQAHILKPQTWIGIVFSLTVYSAITGYIAMMFLRFLQNLLAQSRAQAETLREAKEKIEAADRAKQQFLANISHELNTPLNTILGSLNMLQDKELTLTQRNTLTTVRQSSEHLHQLVNNILDAARLEHQQLLLNPTPSQLSDLLQHIANMMQLKAQSKGLQFILALPESLPTTVHVDELRLRQVLLNLLMNAVKYTPEGYVKLTLAVQQENPLEAQFTFSVEDSGIGVPIVERERLLRPFERGQTLGQAGAGLGLNIVNQLLRQMDSCLMIADVQPQGSCFYFTVKLAVWDWHTTTRFSTTLTELPAAPPLKTLQRFWQDLLLGRLPALKHQLEELAQDARYQLFANEALNLIHSERKKLLQQFLQQFFPQEMAMPSLADISFTASPDQPVVLIIDDDAFNIYLVAHYLRDFRFEILSANNGADGLQLAVRTQPQLILLDIYMPGWNGFETCQRLKTEPSTQAIPVIFFSASIRSEDLTAVFTQKGQDYLLKPLREEEVIVRIISCLQRQVLQQPLIHRLSTRQEELEETDEDFNHCATQLIDKLYELRHLLLENLAEKPHLDELARQVGLNQQSVK